MAINIDTLVHNEFSRSATDQLGKMIGKPSEQIQSGVSRAVTEVLDNFSLMAREEAGRQTIYEASRYSDDGLIDDPAAFFSGKDQRAAISDSNNALGALVGSSKRDGIANAVRNATGFSAQDADTITGYVAPGVLGVMKRQMLNGAVLDNSDGIGQMLLGETVAATTGGAGASVDHSVPKNAPRRADQAHVTSNASSQKAASVSHSSTTPVATSSTAAGSTSVHKEGADLSWLFRWLLPALLLGGLILAGLRNCGVDNRVDVAADIENAKLMSAQTELDSARGEVDGLTDQITGLTAERDVAIADRDTAIGEIQRLEGELESASTATQDTSELDAANAEIVSLKDQLAQPADTSALDAANAEIASLKDQLAQPADTSALDAANAEIASLRGQLAQPADTNALDAASAEIARLQTELANVPAPVDNTAQINSLMGSVDQGELKITQLESELKTVRDGRVELEASVAQARAEKTAAETKTTALEEQLAEVTNTNNDLDTEIEGLNKAVADGEADVAEKQDAIDMLTSDLATMTGERDGLLGKLQATESERDLAVGAVEQETAKLAQQTSQVEVIRANLGRAVDDATEKRKAAVAFQSEISGLQMSVEQAEAELAKAQEDIAAAESAIEERTAALEAANSESSNAKAETAEVQAKLDEALEGKASAESIIEDRTDALEAANGEAWNAKQETAEVQAKLDEALEGKASAESIIEDRTDALEAANGATWDAKQETAAAQEEIAKLTKSKNAAVSTIKDLVGKLRNSQSATADKEVELAEVVKDKEWAFSIIEKRNAALAASKGEATAAKDDAMALQEQNAGLSQSIADAEAARQAEQDAVATVSANLADQLSAAGVTNAQVNPIEDYQAVGITMGSSDLYGVGSASLSSQGVEMLDTVGSIVSEYPDWRIDVEGHTDGQPIGSVLREKYPTNWELSVARAASAVRYLQATTGIPANNMSVRGFGEHMPVDTNETADGREANRRIELILRRP